MKGNLKEKALLISIFSLLTLLSWQKNIEGRSLIGDAPEYLIVAQSIIEDHDIFLEDEGKIFELHRPPSWTGKNLYLNTKGTAAKPPIAPGYIINAVPKNKHLLPYHPLGLSLLIAPGQALLGIQGASLTIALCAALLALNIYLYTKSLSKTLLIVLSPPLLYLALLCFKEIPAVLFTFYAFRKIKQKEIQKTSDAILLSITLASLPWLHPKYILISGLLLTLLYHNRLLSPNAKCQMLNTKDNYSTINCQLSTILKPLYDIRYPIFAFALSLLSLLAFYIHFYGTWRAALATGHPGLINPAMGLLGLLFDREYGLVLNYPLYLLAISGLFSREAHKREGWFPPVLIGLSFLGISFFGNWHGGIAPPGRLVAPALPFLGLYFPKKSRPLEKVAKIALLALSLALIYLNLFKLEHLGCVVPNKINEAYQLLPYGKEIARTFPSITNQSGKLEEVKNWWK